MTRRSAPDPDQADLFGQPPPQPISHRPRAPRARKPAADPGPAPSGPEDFESLAARASPAELDALAVALPDNALAHLALASARQLKRRLARAAGAHRSGRGRTRPNPLERAAQELAQTWATLTDSDEAW